jgi:DNA-directed RNA polymerase specialized sigma24 family protein
MPAAHRKAFELAILDKMPYREIARLTGWSISQVKINVYRARKRTIEGLAEVLPTHQEVQS